MYSSMTFSIVHKLLRGLKDPIEYIVLPFLCFGVIRSILKIWGNFLFIIIWVVRWVIRGAMVWMVFLSIFIEMWSCPTEFLLFDFNIIFLMSDTCGRGMVNVLFILEYMFFRMSMGDTGICGILSLRVFIESI